VVLTWPYLLVALLPPLAVHLMGRRASLVIAAGALSIGALTLAHRILADDLVTGGAEGAVVSVPYETLAVFALLLGTFVALAVAAVAQAIKERRGAPARPLTLSGFWLAHTGLIASLVGATFSAGTPRDTLATFGDTVALAGWLALLFAIALRPALRAARRLLGRR
jgi:hypothetical protein